MIKMPVFTQLYDQPFAHCATLTDLGDAGLMAVWMGGAYETAPDVCLLASQLQRGADEWTQPRVIARVDGHSMGQPVLLLYFTAWTGAAPSLT
jgi:predicted neuraminidase